MAGSGSPITYPVQFKDDEYVDNLVRRVADGLRHKESIALMWAGNLADGAWLNDTKKIEIFSRAMKLVAEQDFQPLPEPSGFGGGGPLVDKEALLTWLRSEIKITRAAAKEVRTEAAVTGDEDGWATARLLDGQALGYEDVIRRVRGLREREFQLEKKRGTL